MQKRLVHLGFAACALTTTGIGTTAVATAPFADSSVPPGDGSAAPAGPTGLITLDIGTAPSLPLVAEDFHAFGTLDGAAVLPRLGVDGFPTFTNGRLIGLTASLIHVSGGDPNEYNERITAVYIIGGTDIAGFMAAIRPAIVPNEAPYGFSDFASTQIVDDVSYQSVGIEATNNDYALELPDWDVEVASGVGSDWSGIVVSRSRGVTADVVAVPELIATETAMGLTAAEGVGAPVVGWQGLYGASTYVVALGGGIKSHISTVSFAFSGTPAELGPQVCGELTPGTPADDIYTCRDDDGTHEWSIISVPALGTTGTFTTVTR